MRSRMRNRAAEVERFDLRCRGALRCSRRIQLGLVRSARARRPPARRARTRRRRADPRGTSPSDERGPRAPSGAGRAAVPEEHQVAARARSRAWRSRRRRGRAASRPACCRRRRQHGVDQVEGRQIDEPGVRARPLRTRARTPRSMSRRASVTTNSRPPPSSATPGTHDDLRVLDRERRGLAHLPADQLIEILRLRRHLLEPHQRHLGDRVGQDERDAPRPRPTACRARGRMRRRRAPRRRGCWPRSAPARPRRPAAARPRSADDHARAALPRDRPTAATRSRGRSRRAADGGGLASQRGSDGAHSTNVTLLISRSVVDARAAPARPPTRAGTACPLRAPPS